MRCFKWIISIALILLIAFLFYVHFNRSQDSCVWDKPGSTDEFGSYLDGLLTDKGISLDDWGLYIERSQAKLEIQTSTSQIYNFSFELDENCELKIKGGEGLPPDFDMEKTFAALPLTTKRPYLKESNNISSAISNLFSSVFIFRYSLDDFLLSTFAFRYNFENLLLIAFVLALYLAIASSKRKKYLERRDYLAGALLVAWAA